MFLLLLLVGSIGFVAMTVLGFSHGGGVRLHHAFGGHGSGGGGHIHSLGGHHAGGSGHHAPAIKGSQMAKASGGGKFKSAANWLLISPLDIFAFCLGAGAAGLAFQSIVTGAALVWIAIFGALVFNLGIVKPLIGFAMKFVSKPSEGLEGIVAHTAKAVTSFDAAGRGLIQVCIDDQQVQILAMLDPDECQRGVRVKKGDEVVVTTVDAVKNSCQVTKELSL